LNESSISPRQVSTTYSDSPSAVDKTVGAFEVSVRMKVTLVQILHAFSDVGHERQLETVVNLHLVVHHYVLH